MTHVIMRNLMKPRIDHMGMQVLTDKGLSLLELSGDAYERGQKYGAQFKRLIARMIEEEFYKEFQGKVTKDELLRRAKRYAPFVEGYSPEIAEELKGMADGSGRSYEEIVMVNALEERDSLRGRGCTAFASAGKATKDGKTYLGQNWDGSESEWWGGELGLLLTVKRKEGVDILDYTNPGILACAGVNSKGISICWNTVPRLDLKVGVPTYIIVAEVLRQKTIGDAINAVIRAERAGCFNFVIADETELYDIEATPTDIDIAYSDEHIAHANHFVSQKFYSKQAIPNSDIGMASTIVRHNRMSTLLKQKFGRIGLDDCKEFLKDHVNYPASICRHPDCGLTLDSWVIVPADREFWIAHGPPCQHEFEKYTLS
jgi:isopenicillin-N N-acyltransferase like protein